MSSSAIVGGATTIRMSEFAKITVWVTLTKFTFITGVRSTRVSDDAAAY